jgi:hypothetical protein
VFSDAPARSKAHTCQLWQHKGAAGAGHQWDPAAIQNPARRSRTLPPSSRVQGFSACAVWAPILRPTSVLPVKAIWKHCDDNP